MNLNSYHHLKIEIESEIARIALNRPPENMLHTDLMRELIEVHAALQSEKSVRGVIIYSTVDGFFSNGLDLDELLASDTAGKLNIFKQLLELVRAIYGFTKPQIALLNGHTVAGGAVLAALSDFRFFESGPRLQGRFSFAEVKIGLAIPEAFYKILAGFMNPHYLREALLTGEAYKPTDALRVGLIDKIFSSGEGMASSEKFMKSLLRLPPKSFMRTKLASRGDVLRELRRNYDQVLTDIAPLFDANFDEALLSIKEKRRARFDFTLTD